MKRISHGRLTPEEAAENQRVLKAVAADLPGLTRRHQNRQFVTGLNPLQQRMLQRAMGKGDDWPKYTDDPMVNYYVNLLVVDDGDEPLVSWEQLPANEKQMYVDEVAALRGRGLV